MRAFLGFSCDHQHDRLYIQISASMIVGMGVRARGVVNTGSSTWGGCSCCGRRVVARWRRTLPGRPVRRIARCQLLVWRADPVVKGGRQVAFLVVKSLRSVPSSVSWQNGARLVASLTTLRLAASSSSLPSSSSSPYGRGVCERCCVDHRHRRST